MIGFRLTSNYFCAGIEVSNNKVMQTAPILKYMKGWELPRVYQYAKGKRWKLEKLETYNGSKLSTL